MTDTKKVSILGCGWLGYPLGVAMLQEGYRVKGSTTSRLKLDVLERAAIQPFLLDMRQSDSSEALKTFLKSDTLIVAYPPGIRENGSDAYLQSIEKLGQAIEKSGLQRIIFISSTSVYSNTNSEVTEDMVPEPESTSGKAMLEAENLLQTLEDRETVVLRMAGLVGYERNPGRFLAGKTGLENGQERINLIHRDDCIGIILKLLERNSDADVLNCCSDTHPVKLDFYTQAAKKAKLEPPAFSKGGMKAYKIVSNKKLKALLNYEFIYGDLSKFDWP